MSSRKITLTSSDGEDFEVDVDVATQSQMIKLVIEDGCEDNAIPLPNVTSKVLTKVIEYCKKHAEKEVGKEQLNDWDEQFVKVDELDTIFDLILAANYLDIKSLLELVFEAAADRIKDLSPEKVRKIFGIENDFTPEEERDLKNEHKWAHDP